MEMDDSGQSSGLNGNADCGGGNEGHDRDGDITSCPDFVQSSGLNVNTDCGGGNEGHDRDRDITSCPGSGNDGTRTSVDRIQSSVRSMECGGEVNKDCPEHVAPADGMNFESKEEAFLFYKDYAKSVGFNAIIKASRRSRITGKFIDAKFVCTRYGNKPESAVEPISALENPEFPVKKKRGRINRSWEKTDCKASMHVKRRLDGRWIICTFIKEHNHEVLPDRACRLSGPRDSDVRESDRDAFTGGLAKQVFTSMVKQCTGSKQSHSQCDTGLHLRLDEGDAQALLDFFLCMQEENPNFFYSVDLNQDHRLRNVFWVDVKSRLDYRHFGDVVFFDTMYLRNEYKLPFAPFVGVNNHFQPVSLGCALIADESKLTYTWLMKAWLKAMSGRSPPVIITDQDNALKETIAEVMPDSRHCYSLWHILNKVPEKINFAVLQDGNFMKKLDKCIFRSYTNEQFESRWKKIVDRFGIGPPEANLWFLSLYEDRESWAPTYMRGIFLGGMSRPQRSDCVNSFFDNFIQRRTTLKDFLEKYKDIVQAMYTVEAKWDFESWNRQAALKSPSPFGKQMSAVYTHEVFRRFQVEILGSVACHPRIESEDGPIKSYKVQDFEENRDHLVVINDETSDLSCSCRCFEFNGFLCRHAMIVLQVCGAHCIPSQYILKRWTKVAKSRYSMIHEPSVFAFGAQRYKDICWQALKLGEEGSLSKESYDIAINAIEQAIKKCETISNSKITPHLQPIQGSHALAKADQDNGSTVT